MTRSCLASAVLLSTLAWASAAPACTAARPADGTATLPAAWREALANLIEATHDEGQPWGCPGGEIGLVVTEAGATMHVARNGVQPMTRHLDMPSDLVPVGKAMLAEPAPVVAPLVAARIPPRSPEPNQTGAPAGAADASPEELSPPRARIDATGNARYGGVSHLLMVGAGLRGTLPLGPFYASLGLRYTTLVAELATNFPELSAWEVGLLGAFGYSVLDTPVRLDVGLTGGVAIVGMSALSSQPADGAAAASAVGNEAEGSAVDGKLGAELRLAIPLIDVLRGLVVADAEMAFASVADPERRIDPALPRVPAYAIGLSLGLEVGVP